MQAFKDQNDGRECEKHDPRDGDINHRHGGKIKQGSGKEQPAIKRAPENIDRLHRTFARSVFAKQINTDPEKRHRDQKTQQQQTIHRHAGGINVFRQQPLHCECHSRQQYKGQGRTRWLCHGFGICWRGWFCHYCLRSLSTLTICCA